MGKINLTLNINLKNTIKILGIILGITTIIVILMYFQKFEVSELTPTIIISDLQENNSKNIFYLKTKTTSFLEKSSLNSNFNGCNCNETLYLTPDYPLISAKEILKDKKDISYCCGYTIQWFSDVPAPYIQVWDKSLKIYFEIFLNENNIPKSFTLMPEMEFNEDYTIKPNYTIKNYLDVILESHEFTLLKTNENEHHYDYLIKDLGDDFLIYTIPNHIENPQAIWFILYKKQKYFNNLFK
ncbi:MAG TPA: hypothetical protein VF677_05690 [Flavobacterium sp.]|jgi:hypothetical protein